MFFGSTNLFAKQKQTTCTTTNNSIILYVHVFFFIWCHTITISCYQARNGNIIFHWSLSTFHKPWIYDRACRWIIWVKTNTEMINYVDVNYNLILKQYKWSDNKRNDACTNETQANCFAWNENIFKVLTS